MVRQSADDVHFGNGYYLSDVVIGPGGAGVSSNNDISRVIRKTEIQLGAVGLRRGSVNVGSSYESGTRIDWVSPPLVVPEKLYDLSLGRSLLGGLFTAFAEFVHHDLSRILEVKSERGGVELGEELRQIVLSRERVRSTRTSRVVSTSYDLPDGVLYADDNFRIDVLRDETRTTTTRREIRAGITNTFYAAGQILRLDTLLLKGARPDMILRNGRKGLTLAELAEKRQKELMRGLLPRKINEINTRAQAYAEFLVRQMQTAGLISGGKSISVELWVRAIHSLWAVQATYEALKVNRVLESLKKGRADNLRFFPREN